MAGELGQVKGMILEGNKGGSVSVLVRLSGWIFTLRKMSIYPFRV